MSDAFNGEQHLMKTSDWDVISYKVENSWMFNEASSFDQSIAHWDE